MVAYSESVAIDATQKTGTRTSNYVQFIKFTILKGKEYMENNWIVYLIFFLLILILPLCAMYFFLFLRKILPIPERCRDLTNSAREFEKKYKKWDILGGLFFIIFGFAGGYVGWWICHNLCLWHASGFTGNFILFPQKALCLMPSVPASLAIGLAGAWISLKLLLKKEDFTELECYSYLKMGFNVKKFLAWCFSACAILTIVGIILPFNCYMIVSEDGLTYNPLMGFKEQSYQYSDIEKVIQHTFIKNRFKKEISIKIEFKDEGKWSSENTEELSNEKAKKVVVYISRRSGLKIKKIEKKRRNLK